MIRPHLAAPLPDLPKRKTNKMRILVNTGTQAISIMDERCNTAMLGWLSQDIKWILVNLDPNHPGCTIPLEVLVE